MLPRHVLGSYNDVTPSSSKQVDSHVVGAVKHIAKPAPYFFNSAIWARSVREAAGLLFGLCALMFAFAWVYVWLISRIELPALLQSAHRA